MIQTPSSSDRIDVFVGTDRSQLLAVAVLDHSIRRHTLRPVQVLPLIDLDLPEPKDLRQGSRTNFSFARFAIPDLKGYQGRALYLDADMLVFRDIGHLWDVPFDGASVIIQEELPDAAQAKKPGAPTKRVKQCSVMMIDCEKCQWGVYDIVGGLDGRYTYEDLMYQLCILDEHQLRYGVPFHWNSLEHYDADTALIHYTDMDTQPWVSPFNKNGDLWMREVQLMLGTGALTIDVLQHEVDLGYFRPSLLHELRESPHRQGYDETAANRYARIDADVGFAKHAEVYARKRQRQQTRSWR